MSYIPDYQSDEEENQDDVDVDDSVSDVNKEGKEDKKGKKRNAKALIAVGLSPKGNKKLSSSSAASDSSSLTIVTEVKKATKNQLIEHTQHLMEESDKFRHLISACMSDPDIMANLKRKLPEEVEMMEALDKPTSSKKVKKQDKQITQTSAAMDDDREEESQPLAAQESQELVELPLPIKADKRKKTQGKHNPTLVVTKPALSSSDEDEAPTITLKKKDKSMKFKIERKGYCYIEQKKANERDELQKFIVLEKEGMKNPIKIQIPVSLKKNTLLILKDLLAKIDMVTNRDLNTPTIRFPKDGDSIDLIPNFSELAEGMYFIDKDETFYIGLCIRRVNAGVPFEVVQFGKKGTLDSYATNVEFPIRHLSNIIYAISQLL